MPSGPIKAQKSFNVLGDALSSELERYRELYTNYKLSPLDQANQKIPTLQDETSTTSTEPSCTLLFQWSRFLDEKFLLTFACRKRVPVWVSQSN